MTVTVTLDELEALELGLAAGHRADYLRSIAGSDATPSLRSAAVVALERMSSAERKLAIARRAANVHPWAPAGDAAPEAWCVDCASWQLGQAGTPCPVCGATLRARP